jgi:hypothetical protein
MTGSEQLQTIGELAIWCDSSASNVVQCGTNNVTTVRFLIWNAGREDLLIETSVIDWCCVVAIKPDERFANTEIISSFSPAPPGRLATFVLLPPENVNIEHISNVKQALVKDVVVEHRAWGSTNIIATIVIKPFVGRSHRKIECAGRVVFEVRIVGTGAPKGHGQR